ncbi:MAG: YciI family protein [Pseudomonadota bacterium]
MQYALLIYEDEAIYGPEKDNPALRQIVTRHRAFSQELGPTRIGGSGLKGTASATTVRTRGGSKTIHAGPFAESKEQLGGFYLIEAPDLDAAIAVAKKVPVLQDGVIEIRPLIGPG